MLLRLVWLVDGAGVACSVPETEVLVLFLGVQSYLHIAIDDWWCRRSSLLFVLSSPSLVEHSSTITIDSLGFSFL